MCDLLSVYHNGPPPKDRTYVAYWEANFFFQIWAYCHFKPLLQRRFDNFSYRVWKDENMFDMLIVSIFKPWKCASNLFNFASQTFWITVQVHRMFPRSSPRTGPVSVIHKRSAQFSQFHCPPLWWRHQTLQLSHRAKSTGRQLTQTRNPGAWVGCGIPSQERPGISCLLVKILQTTSTPSITLIHVIQLAIWFNNCNSPNVSRLLS